MNPSIPSLTNSRAHQIQPVIGIVASVITIILVGFTFYSLHLQIKHTTLQLDKMEAECKNKNKN